MTSSNRTRTYWSPVYGHIAIQDGFSSPSGFGTRRIGLGATRCQAHDAIGEAFAVGVPLEAGATIHGDLAIFDQLLPEHAARPDSEHWPFSPVRAEREYERLVADLNPRLWDYEIARNATHMAMMANARRLAPNMSERTFELVTQAARASRRSAELAAAMTELSGICCDSAAEGDWARAYRSALSIQEIRGPWATTVLEWIEEHHPEVKEKV